MAGQYKLHWEAVLEERERLGIEHLPDPLPHPDQVKIDFENDTVTIVGPVTKEEKEGWDRLMHLKVYMTEQLSGLLEDLETVEDPEELEVVKEDIAYVQRVLTKINRAVG